MFKRENQEFGASIISLWAQCQYRRSVYKYIVIQMTYTEVGFRLKSGLRKIVLTQY